MGADDKKMMTDPFVEGFGKVYKGIVAVGVLCVLVVFPLYFRYYYFDILEAKYQFYYMVMIGMFAVCLLTVIAFLAVDFLEYKLAHEGFWSGLFLQKTAGCYVACGLVPAPLFGGGGHLDAAVPLRF